MYICKRIYVHVYVCVYVYVYVYVRVLCPVHAMLSTGMVELGHLEFEAPRLETCGTGAVYVYVYIYVHVYSELKQLPGIWGSRIGPPCLKNNT